VTLPVILRDAAEAEYDEAFDWYDAQRVGLGAAFANAIQKALADLSVSARMHQVISNDIRKIVVRRFPYCIYYLALDDCVDVVAIFHTSRDPSIWQGRV
jgi:plasmid stabilization system protein ParE